MRCVTISRGFREMSSCLSPFSALSLVRQRIHALRQSTELFEEAHTVAVLSLVMSLLAARADSSLLSVEDSRDPTVAARRFLWTGCCMSVVCNNRCLGR